MEKTLRPILNINIVDQYNINIYPEIKKTDCFLLTPIIKPNIIRPNIINNSGINLKRKRSVSF